jgi:hypothetical protein
VAKGLTLFFIALYGSSLSFPLQPSCARSVGRRPPPRGTVLQGHDVTRLPELVQAVCGRLFLTGARALANSVRCARASMPRDLAHLDTARRTPTSTCRRVVSRKPWAGTRQQLAATCCGPNRPSPANGAKFIVQSKTDMK